MEPEAIVALSLGGVLILTLLLWWRTGRRRRAARREVDRLASELTVATQTAASLRRGEQEAAWAAATTSHRLQSTLVDLDKAEHETQRLSADLSDLLARSDAAERELQAARSSATVTEARIGTLETELATAVAEANEARTQLEQLTQLQRSAVRPDTPPARIAAERSGTERQALAALQSELDYAKAEAAALRLKVADAPSNAGAELQRLRDEVQRLSATRTGTEQSGDPGESPDYAAWDRELRARVSEAVQSATTRLRNEIDHLRLVVSEKEQIIRSRLSGASTPAPPTARPTAVITDIRGIGPKIAKILAEHHIATIADVAALTDADIERLAELMPVYPGRIRDDDWVGQARELLG